jgi:hypothetical protein
MLAGFYWGSLKERYNLEGLDRDGGIILKIIIVQESVK